MDSVAGTSSRYTVTASRPFASSGFAIESYFLSLNRLRNSLMESGGMAGDVSCSRSYDSFTIFRRSPGCIRSLRGSVISMLMNRCSFA